MAIIRISTNHWLTHAIFSKIRNLLFGDQLVRRKERIRLELWASLPRFRTQKSSLIIFSSMSSRKTISVSVQCLIAQLSLTINVNCLFFGKQQQTKQIRKICLSVHVVWRLTWECQAKKISRSGKKSKPKKILAIHAHCPHTPILNELCAMESFLPH